MGVSWRVVHGQVLLVANGTAMVTSPPQMVGDSTVELNVR